MAELLRPGFASSTIRNPASLDVTKIRRPNASRNGVGVGDAPQLHRGSPQAKQPLAGPIPKKVMRGPRSVTVGVRV